MKRLTLIILGVLLCTPLYSDMNPYIAGVPVSGGGGDGFIGTKNHTFTGGSRWEGPRAYWSEFTTTTAGDVTYVYFDNNNSNLNTGYVKVAIWDASGNLLASASTCNCVQVSGTLYRGTLSSQVSLDDSTSYRLGFASGDNDWQLYRCATSGSVGRDNTQYTGNTCPTAVEDPVALDATVDANETMCIWASNDADDTY